MSIGYTNLWWLVPPTDPKRPALQPPKPPEPVQRDSPRKQRNTFKGDVVQPVIERECQICGMMVNNIRVHMECKHGR